MSLISLVLSGQAPNSPAPPRSVVSPPADPVFQAQLDQGQALNGTLHLDRSKSTFRPAEGATALGLRKIRFLRNPTAIDTTRQIGPRWQFHIGAGERFSGELTASEDAAAPPSSLPKSWPVLFRGETRLRLPAATLTALLAPQNERLLACDDFETPSANWKIGGQPAKPQEGDHVSGASSLLVPTSGDAVICRPLKFPRLGRVQWYLSEAAPLRPDAGWCIEIQLADSIPPSKTAPKSPSQFKVETAGRTYSLLSPSEIRLTLLPVTRQPGWHQWTLVLGEEQTLLAIDGQVLALGPALSQTLASLSVSVTSAASSGERHAVLIDDFLMTEPNPLSGKTVPGNTQQQELVWLWSGDEVFGTVNQLSPRGLNLVTRKQTRQIPWEEAAGVLWKPTAGTVDAAPTRGWHAVVELTDGLWSRMREPDRLCLALQNFAADRLIADHAILGRLRLPLREIRRIEPMFYGERRLLVPGPVHLGDEVRSDFAMPLPVGSHFERTLAFDRVPSGKCFCTLLVEDLEPSGPNTPENSPHLATLQAGHLLTELSINGRLIVDLNRYVSQRAKPGQPIRVRVPLPEGLLQPGKNVLRLHQRPAADDPRNFDDCQISQWALDWEERE